MPGSGIIGSYGSFQLWMNIHWKDLCWSWSSNTWPPDAKSRLLWKDPNAGKDWRHMEKEVTEDEMLDSISDTMDMSVSKLQEMVKDREAWGAAVHGVAKVGHKLATEQQQ